VSLINRRSLVSRDFMRGNLFSNKIPKFWNNFANLNLSISNQIFITQIESETWLKSRLKFWSRFGFALTVYLKSVAKLVIRVWEDNMRFHMKYRVVQKTGLFSWTTKLRKKYPWKSKRYVKIFRIMSNLTMYFACHCIIYILCLICTNCHVPQNHNDSIMPTLEFHTILIRNAANKTIINTQKDD